MNESTLRILRNTEFRPPRGLRNAHLQTIATSLGPKRWLVPMKFQRWEKVAREVVYDSGVESRLMGFHDFANSANERSDELVVLLHGWEGSARSNYVLASAMSLLDLGYDTFRLNFRDHGDTHHLNKEIFNSTMVDEVVGVISNAAKSLGYSRVSIVGFSLGGNFALRAAARADSRLLPLQRVLSYCPVMDPNHSNDELCRSRNWVYDRYFVRKWKANLNTKMQHFPDQWLQQNLPKLTTLYEMNEELIPRYTPFSETQDYFRAYAITGDVLANTICDCRLVFAEDDMIIPIDDVSRLAKNPRLTIELTKYGGHVGYLKNYALQTWIEERVTREFSSEN